MAHSVPHPSSGFDIQYTASTDHIRISVTPEYLSEQSRPSASYYVWAYHVTIHNESATTVQLLTRHWVITDGEGNVEHVRGDGVIGQQPTLGPGELFRYTSGCPLRTSTGNMRGWYDFMSETGQTIRVRIPLFFLRRPSLHQH